MNTTNKDIVEMYKTMSIEDIASIVGISSKSVSKILRQNCVKIRSRSETLSITKKLKKDAKKIDWKDKKERDAYIIKLYKDGYGSPTIAKSLGIGKRTVLRVLDSNNIPRNNNYKKEIDVQDALTLYESGMSANDIAKSLDVCVQTVSNRLQEHIKLRSPGETMFSLKGREDDLIKMYKSGKSTYDIAAELNIENPDVISRFLNKVGLIRSRKEQRKLVAKKLRSKNFKSSLHDIIEEIFDDVGLDYEQEFPIDVWNFDYKIGNKLLEIQSYWHKFNNRINADKRKKKHAENLGYKVIYLWQEQFKDEEYLKEWVKYQFCYQNKDFNFSDVSIFNSITDAKKLISKWHYSRKAGNISHCYVAYIDNIPIASCVFGAPSRQGICKKQGFKFGDVIELSRFVIHPNYHKKNFASWFIGRCIKKIKSLKRYKLIVSFADNTFNHNGGIYIASNFKFDGKVKANYWYTKDRTIFHKKNIWSKAKNDGLTELEYASKHGYNKVVGLEKDRYTYAL